MSRNLIQEIKSQLNIEQLVKQFGLTSNRSDKIFSIYKEEKQIKHLIKACEALNLIFVTTESFRRCL